MQLTASTAPSPARMHTVHRFAPTTTQAAAGTQIAAASTHVDLLCSYTSITLRTVHNTARSPQPRFPPPHSRCSAVLVRGKLQLHCAAARQPSERANSTACSIRHQSNTAAWPHSTPWRPQHQQALAGGTTSSNHHTADKEARAITPSQSDEQRTPASIAQEMSRTRPQRFRSLARRACGTRVPHKGGWVGEKTERHTA